MNRDSKLIAESYLKRVRLINEYAVLDAPTATAAAATATALAPAATASLPEMAAIGPSLWALLSNPATAIFGSATLLGYAINQRSKLEKQITNLKTDKATTSQLVDITEELKSINEDDPNSAVKNLQILSDSMSKLGRLTGGDLSSSLQNIAGMLAKSYDLNLQSIFESFVALIVLIDEIVACVGNMKSNLDYILKQISPDLLNYKNDYIKTLDYIVEDIQRVRRIVIEEIISTENEVQQREGLPTRRSTPQEIAQRGGGGMGGGRPPRKYTGGGGDEEDDYGKGRRKSKEEEDLDIRIKEETLRKMRYETRKRYKVLRGLFGTGKRTLITLIVLIGAAGVPWVVDLYKKFPSRAMDRGWIGALYDYITGKGEPTNTEGTLNDEPSQLPNQNTSSDKYRKYRR